MFPNKKRRLKILIFFVRFLTRDRCEPKAGESQDPDIVVLIISSVAISHSMLNYLHSSLSDRNAIFVSNPRRKSLGSLRCWPSL
jgi:hypothetical protein